MIVVFVAAFQASVNLLFLLFGFGLGLGVFHVVVATAALRRIEVTREVPDALLALREFTIRYRVHNRRFRGVAHSLRLSERIAGPDPDGSLFIEGYISLVRPGETVTLDVPVTAPGRGLLRFSEITVSTQYPFGIDARRLSVEAPAVTEVYPALLPLRKRLVDRRAAAWSARARVEERRGSDEFYGLREHRPGESLRWVHWRRTARTGRLLTREMTDLKPQTVLVVLDAWCEAHNGDGRVAREAAVSAAGTLVCDALEGGFKVGLIVIAADPVVIPPALGRGLRAAMMGRLARIGPPSIVASDSLLLQQRWPSHWRGHCILVCGSPYAGLWKAASVLRARSAHLDVLTPASSDFASWFGPPRDVPRAADARPALQGAGT